MNPTIQSVETYRLSTTKDVLNGQLEDGGPLYTETQLEALIKEPFNMLSALLFLALAFWWLRKLGRKDDRYNVLRVAMWILAVGGLGGALFHGFRISVVFLAMDVIPIILLITLFSTWILTKLLGGRWLAALGINFLTFFLIRGGIELLGLPAQHSISLGYLGQSLVILVPLYLFLQRTQFFGGRFVGLSLVSFGLAVFFRWADSWPQPLLPVGTHFLWHSFGCGAAAYLIMYWYKLIGSTLADAPETPFLPLLPEKPKRKKK